MEPRWLTTLKQGVNKTGVSPLLLGAGSMHDKQATSP